MFSIVRSLRPVHWSKNVLIFAPLILAHSLSDMHRVAAVVMMFAAFCIAASGTYLINDWRDVEHDRAHPKKRLRPIASGQLPATFALFAGLVLIGIGVAGAMALGKRAGILLLSYVLLSLVYSFALKRRAMIDVLTLSALYALRVLAGGAAAHVEVSDWLLTLCVFLFVSLALLKRYADLRLLAARGETPSGRGYVAEDADLLRSMGVSCGNLAVLVFALYLNSQQVALLYRAPRTLWLVCPLMLYWIAHMWLLAQRGAIEDDPIVLAAKDPASYAVAIGIVLVALAAV